MNILYHLAFAFWYACSLRRRVVRKNLTESFPEKTTAEIIRIEKQFYAFFCDYVVETLKQFSMSEKQMRRRMTFSGTDDIIRDM